MPVGWDSHAAPDMGDRPQAVINKQLLEKCDLLVAVFWTRLGSPTGEAPSGTVEEIKKHLAAGKPAMLYFSDVPIQPSNVEEAQYNALKEFRAECQNKGLIETCKSLEEFRDKFRRQLSLTISREFGNLGTKEADIISGVPTLPPPHLSETAHRLLSEIAQDHDGVILCTRVRAGLIVETNGKQLSQMGDPRSEARWKGAIEELRQLNLIEPRGTKGEVFGMTDNGYTFAAKLGGTM